MKSQDLVIVKRGYDFAKWLLPHTGKFPKSYRFSVGARIENSTLEFIELITVANMRREKVPLLKLADEALAKVRLLFRLSFELKFINLTAYEFGSKQLVELGRLLGGWMKKPTVSN